MRNEQLEPEEQAVTLLATKPASRVAVFPYQEQDRRVIVNYVDQ